MCTGELDARAMESLYSVVCGVDNVRAETTALLNPVDGLSMSPTGGPSGTRNLPEVEAKHTKSLSSAHFPAHWLDSKHEPDGTAKDLLADDGSGREIEEDRLGYFRIGANDGEKLLKQEMNALIQRYDGSTECWDDVTNAPLVVGLVKAARKLEMHFSRKWECSLSTFTEMLSAPGRAR